MEPGLPWAGLQAPVPQSFSPSLSSPTLPVDIIVSFQFEGHPLPGTGGTEQLSNSVFLSSVNTAPSGRSPLPERRGWGRRLLSWSLDLWAPLTQGLRMCTESYFFGSVPTSSVREQRGRGGRKDSLTSLG